MRQAKFTIFVAMLIGLASAAAQAQSTDTTTPSQQPPSQQTTPTQTPAPSTPATAPPGNALPPVQVIQKEQASKPVVATKKPAAPKAVATAPQPPAVPPAGEVKFSAEQSLVNMSPIGGASIPIDKVPGGVATVSSSQISRTGTDYVPDALQSYIPGVILSDVQGNVFQSNVDFRGFQSSPVDGVPQGLAVYQNGVRINEAFGDTVNYDFLPTGAINSVTVMTGNPIFGLNALGGAISFEMKDGFNYHGFESDTRFGSFGRRQETVQGGAQYGSWAAYFAGDVIHDDGYREFGGSNIRRAYADIGAKGTGSEFHFNFTAADNTVGAAAASPVELLQQGWNLTFSTPQTTKNVVEMPSINGRIDLTDTLTLSGVAYYRHFNQHHVDGNISDAAPCSVDPAVAASGNAACFDNLSGDTVALEDAAGNVINLDPSLQNGLGEIDRTLVETNSYGFAGQLVDKSKWFDHGNQFFIGASYDHGHVNYASSAQLGTFEPNFVVNENLPFVGAFGTCVDSSVSPSPATPCSNGAPTELSDIRPVSITGQNTYYGIYLGDTFDVTKDLTFTTGGRYNLAIIQIQDNTGLAPNLDSSNTYERFNPIVGGTYKILRGVSLYGGYSEANRAPVIAELACADPNNPCLLPSFLTSDPPLKQVVSHTWEAGIRGGTPSGSASRENWTWSLGLFRTLNTDDIAQVDSTIIGRSSFANFGETLRQGVEAQVNYRNDRLYVYANYNFVAATYQTAGALPSPFNPAATECPGSTDPENLCVFVTPGNTIPGVPAHKFKTGFDYWLTREWKFGADLIAASSQIFFGDNANQNAPLGGYAKVNLHTSYDVTDHIQIYGLVDNLFDAHYGVYGTYFDFEGTNDSGAALGSITFTNPQTIVPAPPITAYGGVKIHF